MNSSDQTEHAEIAITLDGESLNPLFTGAAAVSIVASDQMLALTSLVFPLEPRVGFDPPGLRC